MYATAAVLVAASSTTHSNNMNQRVVKLRVVSHSRSTRFIVLQVRGCACAAAHPHTCNELMAVQSDIIASSKEDLIPRVPYIINCVEIASAAGSSNNSRVL